MKRSTRIKWLVGTSLVWLATPAWAQDATPEENPESNDIIVTAQNRAQSVQDVPIAIDVFDAEAIVDAGVTDFRQLERIAPTVNITNDSQYTRVAVRGVGTNSNDEAQDQSIAINVDGEYLNRPNILNVSLFDLDRVEVLRGPQGTLYGRNATGGAINFITRKPNTDEFGVNGAFTYGRFNQIIAEGGVDVPFGIGGLRLSGIWNKNDGYLFHPNTNTRSGSQGTLAGRASLRLVPTDRLTIDVAVEYADVDNIIPSNAAANFNTAGNGPGASCQLNGFIEIAPLTPGVQCIPQNTNFLRNIDRSSFTGPTAGEGRNRQQSTAVRGRIAYDLGGATVTYTGGYRDTSSDSDVTLQPSFTNFDFFNFVKTQSHELRLNGGADGGLTWQLGGFYYNEELDLQRGLFSPLVGANGSFINTFNRATEVKSWALFGQVDLPLTDTLTAVGGLRYTKDNRTGVYGNYGFRFNSGPAAPTTPPTTVFSLEQKDDQVTWLAGLNFQPNNNTLIYGKVSTGYKGGGFDSVGAYAPETNTAYEAGAKLNFGPNGRHLFNLAGFYYDYTDLQAAVLLNPAIGGQTFNAGGATVWGIEAEGQIRLSPNDVFTASVNYLDATYDDFLASYAVFCVGCAANGVSDLDNDPATVTQPNLRGNSLPQSPNWIITVGYDKTIDFGNAGSLTASVFTRFKSAYFLDIFNYNDARQQAYTQTDLSLKYQPVDGKWSIQAFVRNLEDEQPLTYATFISAGQDDLFNFGFGMPRTYGVRVGFDF